MPMGAIIFTDFWLFPKLGLKRNFATLTGTMFNWPAGITWAVTLALSFLIQLEIFFKGLPGWFIAVVLYTLLSAVYQKSLQEKL